MIYELVTSGNTVHPGGIECPAARAELCQCVSARAVPAADDLQCAFSAKLEDVPNVEQITVCAFKIREISAGGIARSEIKGQVAVDSQSAQRSGIAAGNGTRNVSAMNDTAAAEHASVRNTYGHAAITALNQKRTALDCHAVGQVVRGPKYDCA